jgi:hypothetical protein
MDLRNWEMYAGSGNPLVGATVKLYSAVTSHPNAGTVLQQTLTDASGMWQFTGLTDGDYDVKVELPGTQQAKWYKGLVRLGVSELRAVQNWVELIGQSSVAAPASGRGRLYAKTDGRLYSQYGSAGELRLAHASVLTQATGVQPNPSTTSTTAVDIPDLAVTFTPAVANEKVLLIMSLTHTNDTAGQTNFLGMNQDGGGNFINREVSFPSAGQLVVTTIMFLLNSPTPGVQATIRGRWQVSGGTASSRVLQRALLAIEFR